MLDLDGEWQERPNGVWKFRCRDRSGLLWSSKRKTLRFDGPPAAKAALKQRVENYLLNVSNVEDQQRQHRDAKPPIVIKPIIGCLGPASEGGLIQHLVTVKVDASFSVTVSRLRLVGWLETRDEPAPHQHLPPGEYQFVERADGQLVGGLYGPRIFYSLLSDDEEWCIERSVRKLAKVECRNFNSLAEAKAWAIWDARTRSKGHAEWFVDARPPVSALPEPTTTPRSNFDAEARGHLWSLRRYPSISSPTCASIGAQRD